MLFHKNEVLLQVVLNSSIVENQQVCKPAQTQMAVRLNPIYLHSSFWSTRVGWGLKMYRLMLLARAPHVQDPCCTLHLIHLANSSETRVTDTF